MTTPLLLATLAFVDGTLCGFRSAAGRNPRLFLWPYYRASMLRGAVVVTLVLLVFTSLAAAVRVLGAEADWAALLGSAERLVQVYGAFATVTIAALGLYLVGSFDFGVLASVLVLGPFTLARPYVIALGGLWGAMEASTPVAAVMSIAAALVMISFERLLDVGRPPWRGLEGDRRGGVDPVYRSQP